MTDRRLFFQLARAQRRIQRHAEAGMVDIGITQTQAGVLFVLGRHEGATLSLVADTLDIAPSAVTGLCDRMERAGLVERRADDADGRVQRLYLTEAGRVARADAVHRLDGMNQRLADGFTDQELETVARFLEATIARFPDAGTAKGTKP